MRPLTYGLMAEFDTPEQLMVAAEAAYDAGFRNMDAYTPFPVEGLADAIGFRKTSVPLVVLIGALLGTSTAYLLQYWINVIAYPVNVGGRPFHSWPAFIIVCFELTILFGGITAVVGMLALNGLPLPYHPVFNSERFEAASRDKFFLCIEAVDPKFDRAETERFLAGLNPRIVEELPY
jgi:ActD protein